MCSALCKLVERYRCTRNWRACTAISLQAAPFAPWRALKGNIPSPDQRTVLHPLNRRVNAPRRSEVLVCRGSNHRPLSCGPQGDADVRAPDRCRKLSRLHPEELRPEASMAGGSAVSLAQRLRDLAERL